MLIVVSATLPIHHPETFTSALTDLWDSTPAPLTIVCPSVIHNGSCNVFSKSLPPNLQRLLSLKLGQSFTKSEKGIISDPVTIVPQQV